MRYAIGELPTDFTFTGQRDVGLGLMHYGARYYHPALGRFVSADTIVPNPGNPQDLNRYAYVRNNPLKYTDPSGHRLALDLWGKVTMAPHGDQLVFVEVPETVLNEWERRYANYVLTGNEGFFPQAHPLMCRNIDYTLAVLEGMGLGPGVPEGSGIWGRVWEQTIRNPEVFFAIEMFLRGGDEGIPAERPPAGERLEYTETPRDAAARRWRPGDPINTPTRHGYPSWSTVRRRWRINEVLNNPERWDEASLARMRQNLAPQNPETGDLLHLHHISGRGGPDPHNPANILPLWASEHYKLHRR